MLVFPIKFPLKPPGESLCVWATVSCHCSFSDSDETKILKKVENDLTIGGVNTVENLGQVRPELMGWAVLKMGFTNRLCCYYGYANLHAYSLENLSLPCNHLTSDAIKNSCKSGWDYPRVRKRGVGKSTFLKNKVIDLLKCQILLQQSRISLQTKYKKIFLEIMSNGFSDCAFRTTAGVEPTMRFLGWGRLRSLGWFQWQKWWRTVGFQWVFTSFHQLSVGFSYQVSLETAWRVFVCVVHCFLPLFLFRFRWDQNP